MKAGFIGLGAMGAPMAKRVVVAGCPTFVTYHKQREPADAPAASGATILNSPAEVARAANAVITIVPADVELRAIVSGPGGVDPAALFNVIKGSSAKSKMLDSRAPGFLLDDSFMPGFRLDLMKKDLSLGIDSARAEKVPLLLGALASQIFLAASGAGRGEDNFSAAAAHLARLAGVSLRARKGEAAQK